MSSGVQTLSDGELVSMIAENNEAAFTALYHRYWELLLGMAYNRLKDLPAAEDIVHDVFASIWRNRQQLQASDLKNYLAAAVKYMTIAHFRKKEYRDKYRQSIGDPCDATLENRLHYRHLLQLIHEEVDNLPEKCRVVFRYSRQNGMSAREIAQHLGISPKTVDNQLNKAIQHLRLKMKHILHSFFSIFF